MLRYIKIVLVAFVGLEAVFYGLDNILNWSIGLSHVGFVLSQEGNEVYSASLVPAITNATMVAIAYASIITAEILTGLVALKGAADLFGVRGGTAAEFHKAKQTALIGCAMALLVWFCGFIVVGGSLFQMWQHPLGDGSFNGAFIIVMTAGLVYLIINAPEPDA